MPAYTVHVPSLDITRTQEADNAQDAASVVSGELLGDRVTTVEALDGERFVVGDALFDADVKKLEGRFTHSLGMIPVDGIQDQA